MKKNVRIRRIPPLTDVQSSESKDVLHIVLFCLFPIPRDFKRPCFPCASQSEHPAAVVRWYLVHSCRHHLSGTAPQQTSATMHESPWILPPSAHLNEARTVVAHEKQRF